MPIFDSKSSKICWAVFGLSLLPSFKKIGLKLILIPQLSDHPHPTRNSKIYTFREVPKFFYQWFSKLNSLLNSEFIKKIRLRLHRIFYNLHPSTLRYYSESILYMGNRKKSLSRYSRHNLLEWKETWAQRKIYWRNCNSVFWWQYLGENVFW